MSEEKNYNEPQADGPNDDTVEMLIKEMVCLEVLNSTGVNLHYYNMLNVDDFLAGVKRMYTIENKIDDLPESAKIPDDLLEEYLILNGNHILTHLILVRTGLEESDLNALQAQALFEYEFGIEATEEAVNEMKNQIIDIMKIRRQMKIDVTLAIKDQMGDAFTDSPLFMYDTAL